MTFRHLHNRYIAKLNNIIDKSGSETSALILFDTGASDTVISISSFLGGDIPIWQQWDIRDRIKAKHPEVKFHEFESVSGHTVLGTRVHTKNVEIDNVQISDFYYYLIFGSLKKRALLGDDFISHCSFSHSTNGDIHVSAFDTKSYENSFGADFCDLDGYELNEIFILRDSGEGCNETVLSQEELNSVLFSKPKKINI